MAKLSDLIGTKDAAEILGVVASLVRRWVAAGRIPSELKDGRRFLKRKDVEEFAKREKTGGWPRGVKRDPKTGKPATSNKKPAKKKPAKGEE